MICQRCKNEASVHLTERKGGKRQELHLCMACAKKAGLALPESPPNLALDAVVQSLIVANVGELVGELAELACPDCGIKFMEFRRRAGSAARRITGSLDAGCFPCSSGCTEPPGMWAKAPGSARVRYSGSA